MREPLQTKGYWWVPEFPENQLPGELKHIPGEKIELETMGGFSGKPLQDTADIRLINGITSDNKKITLHACYPFNQHWCSAGVTTVNYQALEMFVGHHYTKEDQILFNEIEIEETQLQAWLCKTGLRLELKLDQVPKKAIAVHTILDDVLIGKYGGYTFEACFTATIPGQNIPLKEVTMREVASLRVRSPDMQPLKLLLAQARKLNFLIGLLAGTPIHILGIKGKGAVCETEIPDAPSVAKEINIIRQIKVKERDLKDRHPIEQIMPYPQAQSIMDKLIGKFFGEYDNIAPPLELLMSIRYARAVTSEQYFLNIVHVMEAFHRRTQLGSDLSEDEHLKRVNNILETAPSEHKEWLALKLAYSNEVSLRRRLKHYWDDMPELSAKLPYSRTDFCDKVSNARNYLTHYSEALRARLPKPSALYFLAHDLELLFEAYLLKWLGVDIKVIVNKYQNAAMRITRDSIGLDD